MPTGGWTDRLTDMTQLIVAFRNFANAPKIQVTGFTYIHRHVAIQQTRPPPGNATGI